MNYREYNDNELLSYIEENNEEASEILYKKYTPLVVSFAKKMYSYTNQMGIEVSDLVQEGMLGLSKAIQEYSDTKEASFYTFAKTCIERKIISAVIAAHRQKNKFLNTSVPLEIKSSGESVFLEELLGDNKENPENLILDEENMNEIIKLAKEELTDFELQVFELRIGEFGYQEISQILDKDKKSIDNALQRIKAKLRKILEQR